MLNFPKKSLAYLLETFCSVTAQKQYQLADWRIRPLTDEMALYAKQDTHYLLYVYDVLRNKLGSEAERLDVWNRSRQLCLQVYQKPPVPGPTVEDAVFEKVRFARRSLGFRRPSHVPPADACARVEWCVAHGVLRAEHLARRLGASRRRKVRT